MEEVFGNIDINDVTPAKCEQLRNFFPQFCDCVILTINEQKADFFCAADNCITKGLSSCVTQGTRLTLNPPVPKPIICYLGNLYKDEESVKAGIEMYNNDNGTETGNIIISNLCSSFEHFFNAKRTVYDKFQAAYPINVKNHILQRIKSVFPFFLALDYMRQCNDPTCQHIKFGSRSPKLEIIYCDDTTFEILETHTSFNPAYIVAYIGSNKSYILQLNGNRYSEKIEALLSRKLKKHTPNKLRPIERDPVTNVVKDPTPYQKTAWNVLHTIVREIISSDQWKKSAIIPKTPLSLGEIGSIIGFLAKRLNERQKNPYEMIDDFLKNKIEHIEYTTLVFELVFETQDIFHQNSITYLKFQSDFFATNHVYRHYDEIRPHVEENTETPLYHGLLEDYPTAFPENLPDNDAERSNVEDEIRKCIVMYLYDVPVQHQNNILSPAISVVENKNHIQSISLKK